jgi:hypothetical protein
LFFQSKKLKDTILRAYRIYARSLFFLPEPHIFVDSMPKTGTHLLTNILKNLPKTMMSGIHIPHWQCHDGPAKRGLIHEFVPDRTKFEEFLSRANAGQIVTAHFPWRAEIAETLHDKGYAVVFNIRDPRDLLVSQLKYVVGLRRHYLQERMTTEFANDDERLMALIVGAPPRTENETAPIQPFSERIGQFVGWLGCPRVYVSRFETLVGPRGGGDAQAQRREIAGVAAHVGRPLDDPALDALIDRVAKRGSFTFRRGVIGDWRNHFKEEHKAAFKQQAGQALIDLGYETDLNW